MRARAGDTQVSFTKLSDNPALSSTPANGLLTRFIGGLEGIDGVGPGVSYMTEGGLYQKAGITAVICGPGSIVQAHRPNEYVELEQLAKCELFVRALCRSTASYFENKQETS